MSEYWKSLPRKFCDICKCWFADNKASIDFHERGKRHQENAQKRIQDIQKRGIKDAKKQKKLDDDMAKIERAALAAYKKDLENNAEAVPSNTENLFDNVMPDWSNSDKIGPKSNKAFIPSNKKKKSLPTVKEKTAPKIVKKWYEAVTEDGQKYYWHADSSESRWEIPEEGYVSLEEQANLESLTANSAEDTDTTPNEDEQIIETNPLSNFGPQPKANPYGQWVTIEHKEEEFVDLELPKPSENIVEVVIPVAKDEPRLRIKEKVIGQLSDADSTEPVTFKRRKIAGNKNVRQRTEED